MLCFQASQKTSDNSKVPTCRPEFDILLKKSAKKSFSLSSRNKPLQCVDGRATRAPATGPITTSHNRKCYLGSSIAFSKANHTRN